MEWWNQNIPVAAPGGSTRPPNSICDCDCEALLSSVLWTDITAKCSLDLWLHSSQKQKWKLRSLGGFNLFQSLLFFQRIFFPLWEKRKEKRSMTLITGFLKNIWQRKCLFSSKWGMLLALNETACFAIFCTYFLAKYHIAEQKHCFCPKFAGRN